jgi:hypothetical protein
MDESECAVLAACERACAPDDESCLDLCELAHPAGVTDERAFGACLSANCASTCITSQWTCLETPASPPVTGPPVNITYTFSDYVSQEPVAGLTVYGCSVTDVVACAHPVSGPVTTDSNGQAKLALPFSFDGYAQVTGAGYEPMLYALPPVTHDSFAPGSPVVTQATFELFGAEIEAVDPTLGNLIVQAFDCEGLRAAGVEFSIAPFGGMGQFYFADAIPSATATETDDGYGAGGFLDVEPNTAITITATVAENGLTYPPAVVVTRAGTLTVRAMFAAAP